MSNGPDPVLNYTVSNTPVCQGGEVTVNGSGSTNATDFEWYLTNDNPVDTLFDDNFNSAATFTMNVAPGDYQIWAYADGSCRTSSDSIEFIVNPAVSGSHHLRQ